VDELEDTRQEVSGVVARASYGTTGYMNERVDRQVTNGGSGQEVLESKSMKGRQRIRAEGDVEGCLYSIERSRGKYLLHGE
jgi:hypothetical protein